MTPAPGLPGLPASTPQSDEPSLNRGPTLRVGSDRLYWALIESPPLSRWARAGLPRGRDLDALRYAFEPWIPAPLESIEARFAPLRPGSSTFLACGIERDRLVAMIAGDDASGGDAITVESATPIGPPEVILRSLAGAAGASNQFDELHAALAKLEFCAGPFAGPRRRRLRRRLAAGALAAAVCGSALTTALYFMAAERARDGGDAARRAAASIASSVLLAAGVDGGGDEAGNRALRLAAEVRALERTRAAPGGASELKEDRGRLFIALLARWPESIPSQVESLQIEQATATLRGLTRNAAEAEALLLAIDGLAELASEPKDDASGAGAGGGHGGGMAWTIQSRSLGKSGEATAFTAVLTPQTGAISAPTRPSPPPPGATP